MRRTTMGDAGPHHTTKGLTAVGVIATILVLFINSVGAFDRAWARKHENEWNERVRLAQLVGKGEVLVEFEFSIVTEMDSLAAMTISPALRSLLIDDQHRVDQLDVRMTQGSWDFRNPMPHWLDVPPPGLEMAVNFHDGINDTEIAFQALLNKLSVVMGMSMSSVYPHGVLGSPKIGWFNGRPVFSRQLFASLPQQIPCLDAVDALLRLLPCNTAYLTPHQVINSNLYSISYQIERLSESTFFLTLKLMMVSSPHANLWWENLGDLNEEDSYIGMMRKAFGSLREPQTSLPRKSGTRCVYVYTQSSFTLQSSNCVEVARSMNEDSESNGSGGGSWELYTHANLKSGFNSVSKTLQLSAEVVAPPTNKRHEGMNMLHIFQMVPWEVDVRWHTLQLSINDENVYLIDKDIILRSDRKTVIGWCCLHPAVESVSGSTIEFLIKLPNTTKLSSLVARESHKVSLSVQITKKLLSIFDQSPDASRGIDVPAALVTLAHNASVSASALGTAIASRRTVPLLINLPIADASMPFNVVSFTCTLVALSFSSTVGVLLNPNKDKDGKKTPIKPKLRRAFLVFIVIVTLALYMDPELQRKVDGWTEKVLGLQVFSTVDS